MVIKDFGGCGQHRER